MHFKHLNLYNPVLTPLWADMQLSTLLINLYFPIKHICLDKPCNVLSNTKVLSSACLVIKQDYIDFVVEDQLFEHICQNCIKKGCYQNSDTFIGLLWAS